MVATKKSTFVLLMFSVVLGTYALVSDAREVPMEEEEVGLMHSGPSTDPPPSPLVSFGISHSGPSTEPPHCERPPSSSGGVMDMKHSGPSTDPPHYDIPPPATP
ncbi:hypothetical protein HS088_TW12G00294 [Tripterygium wilfordii]|uniref:Transmembrane protein n=1 Tax=Tripterygium wilfordii TaxID=458696 RepID=A0A7J7CYB3_TRIWF|nr:hypothetical protein HS088_TW12G00294 [Tripterygium wilfordii]